MIKHSITRHNSKLHIHAYNVKFPFLHNLSNVNKKYPCSSGLSKAYAVEKSEIKEKTCFGIWHKIPKLFFKNAFDLSSDYNNLLKSFPCGKQHMLLLLRNKNFLRQKSFPCDKETIIYEYEDEKESVKKNVKVWGPVIKPIMKYHNTLLPF